MQILKYALRKCVALTPYEIKRRPDSPQLPPATIDSIQLLLAYYRASRRRPVFVQVGACDGRTGDPVYEFVRAGEMHCILVEPIPASFKKLQASYHGVPNIQFVQCAIGCTDGFSTIYKVKDGFVDSISPDWAPQLASFDKMHLLRHHVVEAEIEEVEVPCLTLETLLKNSDCDRVDILQVDTEGFDAEVVNMALNLPGLPMCINFESLHLKKGECESLFKKLAKAGYSWTHDQWNTLALHKSLINEWRHYCPVKNPGKSG
jgi:FkbM family methyltransferase